MEHMKKDISSLLECLHINDNKRSYSKDNLDLREEKKLLNKSIIFEDDVEKNQKDCDSDNDQEEEDIERNEDCNDALRKRGKPPSHYSHGRMPYINKHAQRRQYQHMEHGQMDDRYRDQKIDKIKDYLKSMGGNNENRLETFVKNNIDSRITCSAKNSDEILEGILDLTENVATPPIQIPSSQQRSVPQEDCSPQSFTSTESGYTSDSRSSSSSPLPSVNGEATTTSANLVATTFLTTPKICFQICTLQGYSGTLNPVANNSEVTNARKRKGKNKYFSGVDNSLRDKCRRDIRNKEKSKEGLAQRDDQGRTILHVVIEKGNEVYAITFISRLEKIFQDVTRENGLQHFENLASFLDQTDTWGYTPLLLACTKNMSKVVEYLLECGASPRVQAHGSVLHFICQRGKRLLDVAAVLCNCPSARDFIEIRNLQQETALHVAVSNHGSVHLDQVANVQEVVDNRPIVCLLLQKGADICAQDGLGQTPLHKAISTNNLGLIGKLHSSTTMDSWDRAVNLQDHKGKTVLHKAACYRDLKSDEHVNLLNCLIAMKASPHIRDRNGKLPRDYVAEGREDLFRALDTGCMLHLMSGPTTHNVNL